MGFGWSDSLPLLVLSFFTSFFRGYKMVDSFHPLNLTGRELSYLGVGPRPRQMSLLCPFLGQIECVADQDCGWDNQQALKGNALEKHNSAWTDSTGASFYFLIKKRTISCVGGPHLSHCASLFRVCMTLHAQNSVCAVCAPRYLSLCTVCVPCISPLQLHRQKTCFLHSAVHVQLISPALGTGSYLQEPATQLEKTNAFFWSYGLFNL